MTNPFAQNVPTQQAPPAAPAPAQGNPFAQQAPPAAPAPAPVAPQAYAQPQQQPTYAPPAQPQQWGPPAAPATSYGTGAYAQTVPQQAPAASPPVLNRAGLTAVGAPVVGEGRGAKLADMYGRLLLVFPLALTNVPRNPQYITPEQRQRGDLTKDRVTATVVVLDDGQGGMSQIGFGGSYGPPPVPHSDWEPLPYVRRAMWIDQSRLISQLRPHLSTDPRAPGMTCGRLVKAGPEHNAPWYLQTPTEQDLALADKYLELVQDGTYPHPLAP